MTSPVIFPAPDPELSPAPKVSPFLRRLVVGIALLLLVGLAVWWGVWAAAMSRYENLIDGLITSLRQEGYQVEYDDRTRFGFPHHVTLRLRDVSWKSADGIVFHTNEIDISSSFWKWDVFNAHFKNGATLEAALDDGTSMRLSASQGRAKVVLGDQQRWKHAYLVLQDSRMGHAPNNLFAMQNLALDAERPEHPPANNKEPGLVVKGEASDIDLPPSMPTVFGTKMEKFSVAMRVMGAVPDVRRKSAVEVWNRDVGVVEFSRFDMDWGKLHLRARGTMGFDDDLQPEGAFVGAVNEPEPVLKALMDAGFIAARQAGMLNSAMGMFAKPSGGDEGVELPIAVQLGGLFLGPVRVFSFQQIEWQTGEVKP